MKIPEILIIASITMVLSPKHQYSQISVCGKTKIEVKKPKPLYLEIYQTFLVIKRSLLFVVTKI